MQWHTRSDPHILPAYQSSIGSAEKTDPQYGYPSGPINPG